MGEKLGSERTHGVLCPIQIILSVVVVERLELRAGGAVRSGAGPRSGMAIHLERVDQAISGFLDLYHVDLVV